MKTLVICLSILVIVLGATIFISPARDVVLSSVQQGSEYHATSTKNAVGTSIPNFTVLQTGASTLGHVVITGANTGIINIYDATTTNVNLRVGATSTLQVVNIPASTATGTYQFDSTFYNGILIEHSGSVPTTTITWR